MASSCTVQSGSTIWDLSSLTNNKADYTWTSFSGEKIVLNICRSIVTEVFGIDEPDQVGAFIQNDRGDRSIGSSLANLTLTNSISPSPVLLLPNGASCSGSSSLLASTLIHFSCSSAADASDGPQLLGTMPPGEEVGKACAYVLEWRTPAACSKEIGGHAILGDWGAVGVLIGLSFMVLLAYFLGTILYNRFILKLQGSAQLPHFSCPSTPSISLPSLSNPFKRSSSSSRPFGSWRRNGGYGRVPAEARDADEQGDSDEEEGLVGRFGLDSDDDDEDARALEGDSRVWRNQGANPSAGNNTSAPKTTGSGLISL